LISTINKKSLLTVKPVSFLYAHASRCSAH
jgi:hypothetical protein